MTKRAGCIIAAGNQLLVVYQNMSGFWGFPKGSREFGEEVLAAAIRETREETGIDLAEVAMLATVRYKDSRYYFTRLTEKPPLHITDIREIGGCRWVTIDDLLALSISTATKIILRRLIALPITIDGATLLAGEMILTSRPIADIESTDRWPRGIKSAPPKPKRRRRRKPSPAGT